MGVVVGREAGRTLRGAALLLAFWLAGAAGARLAPGERWYGLVHDGATVGYSRVSIAADRSSEGAPLLRVNEETVLRLSDRGRRGERRYQGQRVVCARSLAPLYAYRIVVQDGLMEVHTLTRTTTLECGSLLPHEGLEHGSRQQAAARQSMRSEAIVAAVELEPREMSWDDARDVLLDDLSPVDWMVLAARFGAATEPLSLRAFVSRERERVGLDLAPGNPGGLRFTIQAQTATLGWDDCGLLSRMEAPELGYSLVPGDASVLHATGALEVLSGLTIPSPVSAERLPELQGWALRLTADTYGEELSPRDLTVQGQMFSGSVTATRVSGLFTQSCRTYDGREAPALDAPLEPALQKYTQPEVGIESNHARVVETARALGAGARDRWEAAVRAGRWVHAHVRGDLLVQGSALTGLLTGQGASGTRAKLCVALCRALGVPARQAGGLVLAPPDFSLFVPHYWCEVHMGDAGWIPIDPVFDRYNRLPLGYLTFVHLGGMRRIQSLELVAAEDRKEPEMPLLSATSEMLAGCPALSWEFIVEERLIGESHLRPLGRVELSGKSTYAFALETRIDSRPVGKDYVVQAQARLYLDAAGLPAYYVYQENVGGVVTEATCDFSAETGVLHWRGPGQSAELPLVRTPATFILDRNMIGGWAMLCRRLPRAVGETIPLHALVPGQPLELATTASSTRTETLSDGATAWLYDTAPMGETLWIDADGILCRIDNPRAGLTIRRRSTPPGDGTRSTLRYHGAEPPAGDKS